MAELLSLGRVTPIDPTPYVAVYVITVFIVPWLIYGSFVVRAGRHQMDSRGEFFRQRALRWRVIVHVMWLVGFTVMALTLYFLHTRGII